MLVVISFVEGDFLDKEKRVLSDDGPMQFSKFLTFVPNIASVLRLLAWLIMPLRSESVPLLPLELLVSGTPILTSSLVGLQQVTPAKPAFHYDHESAQAMYQRILICNVVEGSY